MDIFSARDAFSNDPHQFLGYPAVSFWRVYHQGFVTPQLTHLGRSMEADRQMPRRKIAFPLPDVPGEATTKAEDAQNKYIFESSNFQLFGVPFHKKKLRYLPKNHLVEVILKTSRNSQAGDSRSFSNNSWRPWKANCAAACKTMDTWHQVAFPSWQQNHKWTRWVYQSKLKFPKRCYICNKSRTYVIEVCIFSGKWIIDLCYK